jgi:DNA gyrase subunit B
MAGKKVRNEIDGIRVELRTLSEAVWALRDKVTVHNAAAAAVANPNGPKAGSAASGPGSRPSGAGTVISRGALLDAVTGQECRWDVEGSIDDVMAIDDETTARVLAAIGHRQRLAILKKIVVTPSTVADLVAALELGTTGAAYHHLNVLQAADLVTQATRGVFSVPPHRAAALAAIFAGVRAADQAIVVAVAPEGKEAPGDEATADEETGAKGKKRKAA